MLKCKKYSLVFALLLTASFSVRAQIAITGTTCVVPGTTYQYLIKGNWDAKASMQICAIGGVLALANSPCTGKGAPVSSVLVIWSEAATTDTLSLVSSAGNLSVAVTATIPLRAGSIVAGSKAQTVAFNCAPASIACGADSGGTCKPVYVHQWQQSRDDVHWQDIAQATGINLAVIPTQHQTIFFRRMTTETSSGSIAYSDVATVFVGSPPPGTSAADMN